MSNLFRRLYDRIFRYYMYTTIIRVSAIISASVLLSVILTQVNTSEATFLSFKKIQKPELTVYLSSTSGTVNNAVVKASINNQIQTQTVTVSGLRPCSLFLIQFKGV